ncbi:MAG: Gfo/Idh/MocA family oxidoreductase [Pseudomonadota bacterium]
MMKVGLIGVGMVADTHLQALADLADHLQLVAVCASRMETARRFAQKASAKLGHDVEAFSSLDEMFASGLPDIDFAIIATPPNARVALVEHFADAGIPILMEKPIERTSAAAEQIVEICEAASVLLGIVFQHRARAASQDLARRIADGAFGRLHVADIRVPWWREQAYYDEPGRGTYARDGGGVLISQAIHTLDLMLSLTGPVARVQAMARTSGFHTMEAEDFVSAGLEFESGAVGSLFATTASHPGAAESIELHFEKASVLLQSGQLHIRWRDGRVEAIGEDSATGGGADPMAFTHAWHRDVIADFADAVRDQRPTMVSGREALAVHYLIDALVASSDSQRMETVRGAKGA